MVEVKRVAFHALELTVVSLVQKAESPAPREAAAPGFRR
jgi:hypothetical protein